MRFETKILLIIIYLPPNALSIAHLIHEHFPDEQLLTLVQKSWFANIKNYQDSILLV